MQMPGSFNAQQFQPNQGMAGHPPVQKAPFTITGTAIVENKEKDGGFFQVELTSQMGTQIHRYNIWNKSPKAIEIAHGQLSALCHATGRYQINWQDEGAALRGGQGLMDIGYQKGEEPTPEKPAGGYTELKKVYDVAGNEPGKTGQQAQPQTQAQPQQTAPMVAQQGGGWAQGGQAQPSQQQAPQGQGGAWVPGNAGGAPAGGPPPWGQRS